MVWIKLGNEAHTTHLSLSGFLARGNEMSFRNIIFKYPAQSQLFQIEVYCLFSNWTLFSYCYSGYHVFPWLQHNILHTDWFFLFFSFFFWTTIYVHEFNTGIKITWHLTSLGFPPWFNSWVWVELCMCRFPLLFPSTGCFSVSRLTSRSTTDLTRIK